MSGALNKDILKDKGTISFRASDIFNSSSHQPVYTANRTRLYCLRCKSPGVTVNSPACKAWLQSTCTAIGIALERPVPLTYDNMVVGRQSVDPSHKAMIYKGLIYCDTCGATAGKKRQLNYLAQPCDVPQPWGLKTLSQIRKGELPHGLKKSGWPCFSDPSYCLLYTSDAADE